jgi:hypothetical protein
MFGFLCATTETPKMRAGGHEIRTELESNESAGRIYSRSTEDGLYLQKPDVIQLGLYR